MWAKFYNVPYFPTYEEAKISPDFVRVGMGNGYFNCKLYKDRMRISIDTFLLEAQKRGAEQNRKVVAVLTGLGLGMWMKSKIQTGA